MAVATEPVAAQSWEIAKPYTYISTGGGLLTSATSEGLLKASITGTNLSGNNFTQAEAGGPVQWKGKGTRTLTVTATLDIRSVTIENLASAYVGVRHVDPFYPWGGCKESVTGENVGSYTVSCTVPNVRNGDNFTGSVWVSADGPSANSFEPNHASVEVFIQKLVVTG